MSDGLSFMRAVDADALKAHDRALALLWHTAQVHDQGLTTNEICQIIEQAGHPGQNRTRLTKSLSADKRRISRVPKSSAWRVHPRAIAELDALYAGKVGHKKKAAPTDSVLPNDLFTGSRGYLEKVVYQLNASFDVGLFDCCAVMCRRLLETLIIEVYEAANASDEIKGKDGNFLMFADLSRILLADKKFNVSRNAQKGLKDFKALGDQSAHSRRYNARKDDIERVRDGIRVASEELLHLAKLI